jgi:hypothetical protein
MEILKVPRIDKFSDNHNISPYTRLIRATKDELKGRAQTWTGSFSEKEIANTLVRDPYYTALPDIYIQTKITTLIKAARGLDPLVTPDKINEIRKAAGREKCTYPFCPNVGKHSFENCPVLEIICTICNRRGHAEVSHEKHDSIELESTYLIYSPSHKIAGLIWRKNQLAERNDWRMNLHHRNYNAVPKFFVQTGLQIPEGEPPELIEKRKEIEKATKLIEKNKEYIVKHQIELVPKPLIPLTIPILQTALAKAKSSIPPIPKPKVTIQEERISDSETESVKEIDQNETKSIPENDDPMSETDSASKIETEKVKDSTENVEPAQIENLPQIPTPNPSTLTPESNEQMEVEGNGSENESDSETKMTRKQIWEEEKHYKESYEKVFPPGTTPTRPRSPNPDAALGSLRYMFDPNSEMPRPPKPETGKFELTDADHDLLDYGEDEKEEKMDEDELRRAEQDLEAENEYLIETGNTENESAEAENQ